MCFVELMCFIGCMVYLFLSEMFEFMFSIRFRVWIFDLVEKKSENSRESSEKSILKKIFFFKNDLII